MGDVDKKGLALSGGGFRATLYAVGSLVRLNEEGLLAELDTITAVSGGAIAAGYLMLKWDQLKFEPIEGKPGCVRASNFHQIIVEPLVEICSGTITSKRWIALGVINPWSSAVREVRKKYESRLFGEIRLKDIPDSRYVPEFIFYGTNLDTGVSVRIGKGFIRDYQIGMATNHNITLADAVSISSAFPPFLSPVYLDGSNWEWQDDKYQKLPIADVKRLRNKLALCDGGLYDNMGLEMLWKHGEDRQYGTVFCCDAGAPFSAPWDSVLRVFDNWGGKFHRMSDIMINQQRALRKRMLVRNFIEKVYDGAYWSIDNKIVASGECRSLISNDRLKEYENLKLLGTQLQGFDGNDNHKLVNLGYLHTDASLRDWYDKSLDRGTMLPYPSY